MTTKQKLIAAYLFIAIIFAIYGTYLGDHAAAGFFHNLGRGLVWPAIIFPSLGAFIGSIIMVVVILIVLIL